MDQNTMTTADMATADIPLHIPQRADEAPHTTENQDHGHDHPHHDHDEHNHPLRWGDLVRIGLVAFAVVASWLHLWQPFASFDLIALAATLVGGYPIFKEAFSNLAARRMTMELSMTIALVAALVIGEFLTTSVIVLFVLIAEVLEGLTVGRGRRAIKDLLDLLPHSVTIQGENGPREVDAGQVRVGTVVLVRPGARVPVDGEVISGNSFVDQSTITGESMPMGKLPGSSVYAGTINQSGFLEVRTTGVGHDTAFGKIIEAVERAEKSRAPIQKTADRLAGYLVYFAMGCALLTLLVTRDVRSTISVIIVAGACGIAAGTPLAILGAIGRAARHGAIIKGGLYLEILGTVDTIVLDKTGTVTLGRPKVTDVIPYPGTTPEQVVEAAAIAERSSDHPLSKAIRQRAVEMALSVPQPGQFEYFSGRGIVCSLNGDQIIVGSRSFLEQERFSTGDFQPKSNHSSEVLVARNGRLLGAIHVADGLRPEAVQAIAELRQLGLWTVLLTGDVAAVANAVSAELHADEVHADLLPDEKVAHIDALLANGKRVAMIGDGINDAPALTQASVGVAMGSGADVARESADVVLLGSDLLKFVDTLRIARRCRRIIYSNFVGTLVVDGIGVGLAAFGFLNPLIAVFIHVSSELVFILNSARLLPSRHMLM
ncbi:MAG: heavy metal translocating P-type ATPase [Thermoguttaceae bacterium]